MVRACSGKFGVLAQETVTGVNCIDAMPAGGLENTINSEIAFARGRRSDMSGFISQANMKSLSIGVRVHGDAADAELAKCTYQTDCDLAAIGDEDLAKQSARF
jgi:hypothetical protein